MFGHASPGQKGNLSKTVNDWNGFMMQAMEKRPRDGLIQSDPIMNLMYSAKRSGMQSNSLQPVREGGSIKQ